MARPTQIEHLLNLAKIVGDDEAVLVASAGKPLQELTLAEVRQLLGEYHQKVADYKQLDESERPAGTRRRRASLPEGIDEYEQNYLTACQAAGDVLHFVLLNGEELTGRVTGYSPYFITILQPDGRETTLHKLALAYYHKEAPA
jgi:sRNA-binding regulator protein Hfq